MTLGFLVALALSGWILSAGAGPLPQDGLLLLGAGLLLELAAPRLGRFGFFSVAAAPILALAMRAPLTLPQCLLASLVSLILRTGGRGASSPGLRALEFLSDYLPILLALATLKKLPFELGLAGLAAPTVLAFAWVTISSILTSPLPEELQEEWAAYRSLLPWGGAAGGAAALVLVSAPPAAVVGMTMLLGLLSYTAPWAVALADSRRLSLKQREKERALQATHLGLKASEEVLQRAEQAQQRSAAELGWRLEAYQLVEAMLEGISLRPLLKDVAQAVIDRLRRKVRCQTTVLFWLSEDALVPLAQRTPLGERLQASALLQAREPVVHRALKLGRIERALPQDADTERIFAEEAWTLAVPIRDRGVLYFGHPRPIELEEEAMHFLQVMANHAVIALEAADFYQKLEGALQREAAAGSRNELLVHRLAQVIDGVTEIVHLREPGQMLERCGQVLETLIPHHLRLIWRMEDSKSGTPSLLVSNPADPPQALLDYASTVRGNGRPLLLEKFEAGRFPSPAVGSTTLLAVPMVSERGVLGAVVLIRQGGGVFTREDQDILSVLVYQLSAALFSAQLFSQLQEAHKALKESQAQVVQSSKMAAIGQLAGGVAHELNTPLGAIALAVDGALAALPAKPERAESRLNRAQSSTTQMKEIVAKLLFYSRDARSGRRETDLNRVIEDTLQLIGHQLRMDNVEVETQLAPLPGLRANQNELQQVFTNLCLNARDAVMAPGAVQRKILISTSQEGSWLKACVRDWGSGMSSEVREKIFDPFYTTKEVGKGTGLGLSVTLQLLQQHGAKISVESQPGQGAEFTLLLPLDPPEEEE